MTKKEKFIHYRAMTGTTGAESDLKVRPALKTAVETAIIRPAAGSEGGRAARQLLEKSGPRVPSAERLMGSPLSMPG